jgi:hypothetical protein
LIKKRILTILHVSSNYINAERLLGRAYSQKKNGCKVSLQKQSSTYPQAHSAFTLFQTQEQQFSKRTVPIPRNHERQEIFPSRLFTGPFHRRLTQVDSCPATVTRCFQYGEKTETSLPFATGRIVFFDCNSPVPLLSRGKHVYYGKRGHPPWALIQKKSRSYGAHGKGQTMYKQQPVAAIILQLHAHVLSAIIFLSRGVTRYFVGTRRECQAEPARVPLRQRSAYLYLS